MKKFAKYIYVLYDAKREYCGCYETHEEARDDAVGPRFRPKFYVIEYKNGKTVSYEIKKNIKTDDIEAELIKRNCK